MKCEDIVIVPHFSACTVCQPQRLETTFVRPGHRLQRVETGRLANTMIVSPQGVWGGMGWGGAGWDGGGEGREWLGEGEGGRGGDGTSTEPNGFLKKHPPTSTPEDDKKRAMFVNFRFWGKERKHTRQRKKRKRKKREKESRVGGKSYRPTDDVVHFVHTTIQAKRLTRNFVPRTSTLLGYCRSLCLSDSFNFIFSPRNFSSSLHTQMCHNQ